MGAAAAEEKARRVRGRSASRAVCGRSAMESVGGCICSMRGGSEEGEGEARRRGSGWREEARGGGGSRIGLGILFSEANANLAIRSQVNGLK
jgi:hypothetical protein